MRVRIKKQGGEYHINLPKKWVEERGLREGDELDAHFNMDQIVVRIPREGVSDLIFGGRR